MTLAGDIGAKIEGLFAFNPAEPLIFNSGLFLFLFAAFLLIYSAFRRAPLGRMIYVILFSLFFYYKASGWYLFLLLFVAASDFLIARAIARSARQSVRRWLVTLSVVINLGLLAYFKYTNFLIGLTDDLFGADFLQFQKIFLPIGISFFLFRSISYTIDVYRRQFEPLQNPLDYLFFLSFFPLLMAGPIVRAKEFVPQIRQNPLTVTREMFGMGIFLIVIGLFKKAIISDFISLNFVDRIFDQPLLYSGFENLTSIYAYALQIYCDFSGYSDMAIGISLLLGFRFSKNFDAPYKSATITEFWRRWHISLSLWLRDYLYISLGGNRKGKVRTYINLFLTMLLGGLWHGASLRFLLWGALHGAALIVHKLWLSLIPSAAKVGYKMSWGRRIIGVFITFHVVCFGWLFFRADSMQTAFDVLHRIFHNFSLAAIPQVLTGYAAVFALIGVGYVLHLLPCRADRWAQRLVIKAPAALQILLLAVVIWCVMQVKSSELLPFIYAQF